MDSRPLQPGNAVARGRCVHHPPRLAFRVCRGDEAARDSRIPFECITRADRLNERVAATLAELGCFRVWIGSESGSQRILDAMQRGVTVEQVRNAVRLCKTNGIQTGMFLMWGYEGEEMEDIEATVSTSRHAGPMFFSPPFLIRSKARHTSSVSPVGFARRMGAKHRSGLPHQGSALAGVLSICR